MAGNVIVTMLASSWPMNAPKQTTLTASHGARRPRLLMQNTSVSEHLEARINQLLLLANLLGSIPGLTPDMPGVVLALAFRTRQTQGGGVVQGPRVGRSARVRRESASKARHPAAAGPADADGPERKGRRCRNCASSR